MKKADNFNASKWLVENKITFQSRLNEDMAKEKMYEVTVTHKITKESSHVWVIATSEEEARKNVENSGMKMEDYYISSVAELYSEDLDESRLNENKIPGVDVEVDDDMITLSGDSGDYDGFIEDDGTVSFTVTNDEEEFDENNWKSILGKKHAFVKIANAIDTKVEALGDYVMITVKADDLTSMNESKLNEDLTSQIAALPNHHTAENTAEATLVVGKYAVVHYDESDEGGEDMYVVWDNTVNQDEIGSYDDEPEFESADPAEVAAFLKKNS